MPPQNPLEGSKQSEFVKNQEKSDQDQQDAGGFVDDVDELCGPLHEVQDGMDEKRKDHKGKGKACRIHGQEQDAFEHRVLVSGHNQDGAQHGADAGAPSCAKGHADDKGAHEMKGFPLDMEPPFKIKRLDADDPQKMKPEYNDNTAAKIPYYPGVLGGNAAQK